MIDFSMTNKTPEKTKGYLDSIDALADFAFETINHLHSDKAVLLQSRMMILKKDIEDITKQVDGAFKDV